MPSKSPAQRLTDILENIDAIAEFTAGMTFAGYRSDRKTIYAVTHALKISRKPRVGCPGCAHP